MEIDRNLMLLIDLITVRPLRLHILVRKHVFNINANVQELLVNADLSLMEEVMLVGCALVYLLPHAHQ